MSKTATLKLRLLKCIHQQERGGDEIYLKLDETTVFSVDDMGLKMAHWPPPRGSFDQFDFTSCQYRDEHGLHPSKIYKPGDFTYPGLTGPVLTVLQLWESDAGNILRSGDDLIGQQQIEMDDLGVGLLTQHFQFRASTYMIKYEVVPDAEE